MSRNNLDVSIFLIGSTAYIVTTWLENLEMSQNMTAVGNVGDFTQGKYLVGEKLLKTVHCKLHICVHTYI